MAVTRAALTEDDLRMLVRGPTPDERALAAHKICRSVDRAELTPEDRALAQDILRLIARDASELVRRSLAVTLKASPSLPRDVARRLARDVEGVALPVINFSPCFTDEDLVEILKSGGPARQVAVAKRAELSETVTDALAEVGCEEAVRSACANDNARFSEAGFGKALDRYGHSQSLIEAMARRNALPLAITERMVHLAVGAVREHLIDHHALSPETALQLAMDSGERATVDLVDQAGRTADVQGFVAHLKQQGRLTPSLLLRGLAHGHMTFFEWGLAELAGVPHHRTWLMIHDGGPLGLRAVYERAGLPGRMFQAFRAGVDTYHSMTLEGGARDRRRFQERMLQRFLTQPTSASKEDVDYLLEKMDRLAEASSGRGRRAPAARAAPEPLFAGR